MSALGRRRSRAIAGYARPLPSFEGASRGNDPLQRLAMDRNFHLRLRALETKTNSGIFSSDQQAPVTQPPSRSSLAVASGGLNLLTVAITNPETLNPKTNPSRSPVIHQVEFSADPKFATGVSPLPPSNQNHYVLPTGGKSIYVRLSSSFDGVTFNTPQISGPHR